MGDFFTYSIKIFILVQLIISGCITHTIGQDAPTSLIENPDIWFDQIIGVENSGLIQGPEYIIEYAGINTHPFFQSKSEQPGNIHYFNNFYQNVLMAYEIHKDILLLKKTDASGYPVYIRLYPEEVVFFELGGHRFERIVPKGKEIKIGFYDILYQGQNIRLLAKRIKKDFFESIRLEFKSEDKLYLEKDEQYFALRSKAIFFEKYPNHKAQIKKYIRENKLKINLSHEEDIVKLCQFCDSL